MKIYEYGYVESDFTEGARVKAEAALANYRKTLETMYKNSVPGSVVRTQGVPRTQNEIKRLEYFLSQF